MREDDCPPNASMLMESTRSVGYRFESAIADIIDNSISAGASEVRIKSVPSVAPYVAILDDGQGLTDSELFEAMRYGADPNTVRSEHDLGRFGLGLKMASLSQCRRLTVVSLKNGELAARRWDLDRVIEKNSWVLQGLDLSEASDLPLFKELEEQKKGTLVVWQNIDKVAGKAGSIEESMAENLQITRDHLALVFHRFLDSESLKGRLAIYINNSRVEPADPFLSRHPGTQQLPGETIRINGSIILVKSFILPHPSKISVADAKLMGGRENMRRLQGFYVYRNKRLIIPGTWFRITANKELRNLARVRVDIPNTLDGLWDIDIKKSTAVMPPKLRERFSQFLGNVTKVSEDVHRYKGKKRPDMPLWDREDMRDRIQYSINRGHPFIKEVREKLDDELCRSFDRLLVFIERSVPYPSIYADMGNSIDLKPAELTEEEESDLCACGVVLLRCGRSADELARMEPFCNHPEIVEKIIGVQNGI